MTRDVRRICTAAVKAAFAISTRWTRPSTSTRRTPSSVHSSTAKSSSARFHWKGGKASTSLRALAQAPAKLGRFERIGHRITRNQQQGKSPDAGGEFVYVCVDDASRFAFSNILPDEKKESTVAFLRAALAYYQSLGVTVHRVMTDNGSGYRLMAFRDTCRQ